MKSPCDTYIIYPSEYKNNCFIYLLMDIITEWVCQWYRVFNPPIIKNGKRQTSITAAKKKINEPIT